MGSDSWKTWALVFALIIFGGLASAAWPFISSQIGSGGGGSPEHEPDVITIDFEAFLPSLATNIRQIKFIENDSGYLIDANKLEGLRFSESIVLGLLIGVTLVSIGAIGFPLAIVYARLGHQVEKTYGSDDYQEARNRLSQKEDGRLKVLRSGQPTNTKDESDSRWPAISTGLAILLFVWLGGIMLAKEFYSDSEWIFGGRVYDPAGLISLILVLVAAVTLYLVMRGRPATDIDAPATDYRPVNWGMVWVILSGMLVVGVGLGLALVMRTSGGG